MELELEHYGLLMEGGSWTFAFGLKNGSTVHYRGDAPRLCLYIFCWSISASVVLSKFFVCLSFCARNGFSPKKSETPEPENEALVQMNLFFILGVIFR